MGILSVNAEVCGDCEDVHVDTPAIFMVFLFYGSR